MKVGIIGTGNVGSALAAGLSAAGHDVVVGSRDPATNQVNGTDVVSQQAAAEQGDAVVLALPASVIVGVAGDLRDALTDKLVIDAANEYPAPSSDSPLATRVANAAPGAHVVKTFNTIGANRMASPVIDGESATMFLAGDDPDAVKTAKTLARDLGFDPLVAGGLTAAGHLEHLARFWIHLSQQHGRDIGFRLLREGESNA